MKNEIKFAFYAIKKNIQSNAELRTSFLMNVFGMAINNIAFVFLWIYFVKSVGVIGGWTTYDIVALNGFAALSYGVIVSIFYGMKRLPEYVLSGSFDQFMLSPKNIILRIATAAFGPSALGDVLFGAICLGVYGFIMQITFLQIIYIFAFVVFGSIVFFSMSLIINSLSFYFIDATSIIDGVFQFFFTPTLFHGGAFHGLIRFFFTFVVPSLLIAAVPVETVKNLSFSKFIMIGALSLSWLFLGIFIFKRAVRKYESSNFMSFGN
jgi:ABC-2 type transport system permease protein